MRIAVALSDAEGQGRVALEILDQVVEGLKRSLPGPLFVRIARPAPGAPPCLIVETADEGGPEELVHVTVEKDPPPH